MGIFDHRKHWIFKVTATPERCEQAFTAGLGRKTSPLGKGSKWDFHRVNDQNGDHLVGVYQGERGWVGVMKNAIGGMSQVTGSVNAGMSGAQLAFKAERGDSPGTANCEMWLKLVGQFSYGHIAGASLWRTHMRNVESELRSIDSGLQTARR